MASGEEAEEWHDACAGVGAQLLAPWQVQLEHLELADEMEGLMVSHDGKGLAGPEGR